MGSDAAAQDKALEALLVFQSKVSEALEANLQAVMGSNAAAQGKALETSRVFQSKASEASTAKYCDRICTNIVAKCLSGRASTVMRATDVLLGFVELEQSDKVVSALVEGFVHKIPKVVVACLEAVLQLFSLFGAKVITPQPVLKALPKLFETKDGKARDKVKDLVVEMSRWVGPDLIRGTAFTAKTMRDAMKDDIERGMTEVAGPRPQPQRVTRKEAARLAAESASGADVDMGDADADGDAEGDQEPQEEVQEESGFRAVGDGADGADMGMWDVDADGGGEEGQEPQEEVQEEVRWIGIGRILGGGEWVGWGRSGGDVDLGVVDADGGGEGDQEPQEEVLEEDILPGLKKEFWEGLESKKWSERKASLTQLKEAATYPRLAAGREFDYGDVNRELRKCIAKDANVMCVAEAANCYGALAKGLRNGYSATAKEKNVGVTKALAEALTIMHKHCWVLSDVAEDFSGAMGHVTPKVREETLAWLAIEVGVEKEKEGLAKLAPALLPAAAKCAEDAAPSTREAAMSFLVAFAVKVGKPAILDKYTTKMDEGRKKKMEELVISQLSPGGTGGGGGGGGGGGPPAGLAVPVYQSSIVKSSSPRGLAASMSRPRPRTGAAVTSSLSRAATAKPAAEGAGAKKAVASGDGGDDEISLSSGAIIKADALAGFSALLGEATSNELISDDWKVRLGAMEQVVGKARDLEVVSQQSSLLVQGLQHMPGWSDKNFQVMAKMFEVVKIAADTAPSFSKRDAFSALDALTEKLSDMKLKGPSSEALLSISDAHGPKWLAALLHKKAVLSEGLNWLSMAVEGYGLASLDVKALIGWCKEDLLSPNAGVRNSTIHLLGTIHKFLGPPLGDMIRADVKPALMSAIDGEFAKCPKHEAGAFQPSRTSRADAAKKAAAASGGAKGASNSGAFQAATEDDSAGDGSDMFPRQDISASITSAVTTNMGSSNWKERKAAMDDVEAVLTAAGGRILPQGTADLFASLKPRLADSNKNLAVQNISEKKDNVRNAVVELLDAWVGAAGTDVLLPEVSDAMLSPKCLSEGKAASLNWLATSVVECNKESQEQVGSCLHMMAVGSVDKTAEVRDAANTLAQALLNKYSMQELSQATNSLESAQRKPTLEALSKVSGEAVPSAAVGAASVRSSVSGAASLRSSAAGANMRASTTRTPGRATTVRSSLTLNKGTTAAAARRLADAEPEGPVILMDTKKADRAKRGKFRSSKFEIRPEEAQDLEKEISLLLSPPMRALMFVAAAAKQHAFKRHSEASQLIMDQLGDIYEEVGSPQCSKEEVGMMWKFVMDPLGDIYAEVGSPQCSKEEVGMMWKFVMGQLGDVYAEVGSPQCSKEEVGMMWKFVMGQLGDIYAEVGSPQCSKEEVGMMWKFVMGQLGDIYAEVGSPQCSKEEVGMMWKFVMGQLGDIYAEVGSPQCSKEEVGMMWKFVMGQLGDIYAEAGYHQFSIEEVGMMWESMVDQLGDIYEESLMKVLEMLKTILGAMIENGAKLTEYEAKVLFPALVYNSGHNQDKIKADYKELFRMCACVYPASKDGLECKNNKTKVICAEEVGAAIEREGPVVYRANKQADIIGMVARLVTERDTALRQGVLMTMEAVYSCEGNNVWRYAGKLSDQQRSLIEERFKYTDKDLARMGVAPGYRSDFMSPEAAAAAAAASTSNPMEVDDASPAKGGSPSAAYPPAAGVGTSRIGSGQPQHPASPAGSRLPSAAYAGVSVSQSMTASQNFGTANVLRQSVAPSPIQSLSKQTEDIFSDATVAISNGAEPNTRACKYSLNTLMNIFQNPTLATCMREETLCALMSVLLCCLVDESLAALQEGMAMLKALNLLMMKILENCNRTHVFGALMLLLRQPHARLATAGGAGGEMESRWFDLVVKCMIKVTKNLSATIDAIDLRALLLSIHNFFEALGGEEIRRRGARDDKPLRMVKTILHEVCKFKGVALYEHARSIPGADLEPALRPIIFPYIDLNMQTIHPQAHQQHGRISRSGGIPVAPGAAAVSHAAAPPPATSTATHSGQPQPASSAHADVPHAASAAAGATTTTLSLAPSSDMYNQPAGDDAAARNMLAAIFKRIAEKDHQALDIDSMLSSASTTFKSFIQRGLYKVRVQIMQQDQQRLLAQQVAEASSPMQQSIPREGRSWGSPIDDSNGEAGQAAGDKAGYQGEATRLPGSPSDRVVRVGSGRGLGGSPQEASVASPSSRPRVGEDKIAELRSNNGSMTRMAAASVSMGEGAADLSSDTVALDVDNGGGSLNSMAALQERIKRLGINPS
eukprot:gene1437-32811_t